MDEVMDTLTPRPFPPVTVYLVSNHTPLSCCPLEGSASISVQTLGLQRHHASTKHVNAGAAIHGALERLQPVDLSLRLPIAPGFQDGIANGLDILP
jgi:hypothetical protein